MRSACDCGACDACDEADFDAHDDGAGLPCRCDACRRVRARGVAIEPRPVAGGLSRWALSALGWSVDE